MKPRWGPYHFAPSLHGPFEQGLYVPGKYDMLAAPWMEDFLFTQDGSGIPAALLKRWIGIERREREIDASMPAEDLAGDWWFCGFLFNAFGHNISEGISRLWAPIAHGVAGHVAAKGQINLLFVELTGGSTQATKQAFSDLVRLYFRHAEVNIRFLHKDPCRIERLYVPEAALEYPFRISPMMQIPFAEYRARLATSLRGARGPERLYLSRSKMGQSDTRSDFRTLQNEHEAEALFRDAGFEIVHPQDLSFAEQIAMYRDARIMAGPNGSALHNCIFAANCETMVEILTPPKIWGAKLQNTLNAALGIRQIVLRAETTDPDRRIYNLDLARLDACLADL